MAVSQISFHVRARIARDPCIVPVLSFSCGSVPMLELVCCSQITCFAISSPSIFFSMCGATRREIEERVEHFASGLEQEGLTPPNPDGMKLLALYSRNRPEWVIAEQVHPLCTLSLLIYVCDRLALPKAPNSSCRNPNQSACKRRGLITFKLFFHILSLLAFSLFFRVLIDFLSPTLCVQIIASNIVALASTRRQSSPIRG